MPKEKLGLFDSPPSRGDARLGLAMVSGLFVAVLLILPFRDRQLGEVQAFVPTLNTAIVVGEIIIATMLFSQAAIFRSRGLMVLASAYVFTAVLLVFYILTFPGVFSETGLLGAGISTAAWIMVVRRLAFPVAVIVYALSQRGERHEVTDVVKRPNLALALFISLFASVVIATFCIGAKGWLPELFASRTEGIATSILIFNIVHLSLLLLAALILYRTRQSVLDLWLLVATMGLLIHFTLNLALEFRFTLGWYSLHLLTLLSHVVVLVALIVESNRLYARLALATAARDRERESRLMSMDAVASAIAHEVGQPLTAIGLNASAGLNYLTNEPPNTAKAIDAFREAQDNSRRAFDVIKSVRATFSKGKGIRSTFNLNDLAVETVGLLSNEITASKVHVEVDLRPVPSIEANRVQIQRILINLITNSIEALRGIRRARNIIIRSAADDGEVLLEVTDTGVGIPPDKVGKVFEPFVTTKESGTGLGLSLCRTIVEEHGGKLWVSSEERHGSTFHLRLPLSGVQSH